MNSSPSPDSRPRTIAQAQKPPAILPGIQLLRGMAALFVVIGHCNALFGRPEYLGRSPLPYLEAAGGFSVAVFFVISGFIICVAALDSQGKARMTAGEFARRRFIRIIPFLWVCVIGYNILSFAGTGAVEWMPALRALTLWPIGELKPNVVWSLRHEALFYILFALAYLSPRALSWPLLLWFVSPVLAWFPAHLWATAFGNHPYLAEIYYFFLQGSKNAANLQFACGVAMGLAWLRGAKALHTPLPSGGLMPATLVMTIATALIVLTSGEDGASDIPKMLLWTGLATLAGWAAIIASSRDGIYHRVAMMLGDASYSIYLVHNAVLLVVIAVAKATKFPVAADAPLLSLLIAAIAAALFGGIIVHFIVEKPLIRALTPRRKQASLPVGIAETVAR